MLKKIDGTKVQAGDVVGNFEEDDVRVYLRTCRQIQSCKSAINRIVEQMGGHIGVQGDIWSKYDYDEDTRKELVRRGLTTSVNARTGEIAITNIDEVEKLKTLLPYILQNKR